MNMVHDKVKTNILIVSRTKIRQKLKKVKNKKTKLQGFYTLIIDIEL